ncbi:MAG: prepilin-type N-terminal cleavage/methylation domain-containing protein [Pseudomonadota bacterium]
MAKSRNSERGFTLLELLISLGLLALIIGFLFSSIGTLRRVWDNMETVAERSGHQAVRTYLQQRLSQAMFVLRREGGRGDVVAFEGGRDRVSFVAEADGALTVPGLYRVSIGVSEAPATSEGQTVYVEETLHRPRRRSRVDDSMSHRRTLAEGVVDFRLRYFGSPTATGGEQAWFDSWTARRKLPRLIAVRLTVANPDGGEETWPEIVVATRNTNARLEED